MTAFLAFLEAQPGNAAPARCGGKQHDEDFQKAQELREARQYEAAADIFERLSKVCPCRGLELWLGTSLYEGGNSERALSSLKSHLKCNVRGESETTKASIRKMIEKLEEKLRRDSERTLPPETQATPSDLETGPVAGTPPVSAMQSRTANGTTPPLDSQPKTTAVPSEGKPSPSPAPAPIIGTSVPFEQPPPALDQREPTPIYKKWWFWTATGVVAAGIAAALIVPRLSAGDRCDGIGNTCLEYR